MLSVFFIVLLVACAVLLVAHVVLVVAGVCPLEFALEVLQQEDEVLTLGCVIWQGVGNIRRWLSSSASIARMAGLT